MLFRSANGTSTTGRYSWANIVKNIDKAPLPKSTITLEEEINKEIYEDSEDYSLKNNKEFSLSSSEPSYGYFSIASDDDSLTTVHVNNEHSMSNKSEISDEFNDTENYEPEPQRNLDTQEHLQYTTTQVQKSGTKKMHGTTFSVNYNDSLVHYNLKNNKIMRTNALSQTV